MQQRERDIERGISHLTSAKTAWARMPLAGKTDILRAVQRTVYGVAAEWVDAATSAKGLRPGSALAGEEWISGPWAVLYAINRYVRTLNAIARIGRVPLPALRERYGRTVLDVFPHDVYDRVLLSGIRAEVWMQPGVTADHVRATAGSFYRRSSPEGRIALILGAGNISSIAPLDVLYKMLSDGAVCMLKMNPVNEYLGPIFERALQPLVENAFLRFAYGGPDAGKYLCAHPAIDEIHLTGSQETHNAIASGMAAGKPMTSELGNVTPTIVVPGRWSARDIAFQAEHIATQKAHNAGFNCVASQILILPRDWPDGRTLRQRIDAVFALMEQRPEYYPGATQRRTALAGCDSSLRTLLQINEADIEHPAFTSEAFCGVLGYVEIAGAPDEYVRKAVSFANDRLRGTLAANIIVHPERRRSHRSLLDEAVLNLRYGCVGVNAWTGAGYFITETPWGAYPGHTIEDAGSGIGVVHNAYFLERTEKTVVYQPFTPFPRSLRSGEFTLLPKPPWFVLNRNAAEAGRALCDFEMARSPGNALRVARIALRA